MYILNESLYFPPVIKADRHGLLAIGGDLRPERLMLAYRSGIFPWFDEHDPILWWAPPKRMVLFFPELKVSKSMRQVIRKGIFKVTVNQDFRAVMLACKHIYREGQDGTWITDEMVEAYCALHSQGIAQSVEVWQDDLLVGGLYGVDLGHIFCGESMFSKVPNASKTAFIYWAQQLESKGYKLLDCQNHNDHLASLGAREISRDAFMSILSKG
ncbi:Leucyl/phenylalanyl-tRNA--protein transferase [Flavobacterium longum]|uniref:leucyl/phenylalanyl-tRNA--protein transferase n=1 Tax=Flavobacterium longum TaxID=1299340 RepID=UPI0039EB728C